MTTVHRHRRTPHAGWTHTIAIAFAVAAVCLSGSRGVLGGDGADGKVPTLRGAVVDITRDAIAGFSELPPREGSELRHELLIGSAKTGFRSAFPGYRAVASSGISYDNSSGTGCCIVYNHELERGNVEQLHPARSYWSVGRFNLAENWARVMSIREDAYPRCAKISVGGEYVAYFDVVEKRVFVARGLVALGGKVVVDDSPLDVSPQGQCSFAWAPDGLLVYGRREDRLSTWLFSPEKQVWTHRPDLNVATYFRAGERSQ
jgi:hypothetical protein